jgi:hypothetical protein
VSIQDAAGDYEGEFSTTINSSTTSISVVFVKGKGISISRDFVLKSQAKERMSI